MITLIVDLLCSNQFIFYLEVNEIQIFYESILRDTKKSKLFLPSTHLIISVIIFPAYQKKLI
jgi:hypothetical protein